MIMFSTTSSSLDLSRIHHSKICTFIKELITRNDEYKIDKKNGLILKTFLPFDSHYSMVTDNVYI